MQVDGGGDIWLDLEREPALGHHLVRGRVRVGVRVRVRVRVNVRVWVRVGVRVGVRVRVGVSVRFRVRVGHHREALPVELLDLLDVE